ncbi:LOW QUALITY PROTEIN: hypothetical protein HJC23_003259 [Cyclotella cryptica]|uniref:Uncharacterized protein n=1 Tax=Cyclotella cryptica TaxID=29204 RepID=A0ABD3R167_9STRA
MTKEKAQIPIPSRETESLDLELISRRVYEDAAGDVVVVGLILVGGGGAGIGAGLCSGLGFGSWFACDAEEGKRGQYITPSEILPKLTNNLINPTLQVLTRPQHLHSQKPIRNRTRTLHAQPPFNGLTFVGVPIGIDDGIFHDSFGEWTVEFFGEFVVVVVTVTVTIVR